MPYKIEKKGGMFYLYTKRGHKLLGSHPTEEKAKKQRTAIIMSELGISKNPKK